MRWAVIPLFFRFFGWASCYLTYSIGAASQRLYDNDNGVLDAFGQFWIKVRFIRDFKREYSDIDGRCVQVAAQFADQPNMLGYEILNEPWLGAVYSGFCQYIHHNIHHYSLLLCSVSE